MIAFCCRSSTSAALPAGFPLSGGIEDYLRQGQLVEDGCPVSLAWVRSFASWLIPMRLKPWLLESHHLSWSVSAIPAVIVKVMLALSLQVRWLRSLFEYCDGVLFHAVC